VSIEVSEMEGFRSGYEIWKEEELEKLNKAIDMLRKELSPFKLYYELTEIEDLINEFCDTCCDIKDCAKCSLQKAYLKIAKLTAVARKLYELENVRLDKLIELVKDYRKEIARLKEEIEEVLGNRE